MQQVGAKGFADAQLVDPRQLPVPIADLPRLARQNFSRAWILHRTLILRAVAAGVVVVVGAGLLVEQDRVSTGATALYNLAQGEFARAGFGISSIKITGQTLTREADVLKAEGAVLVDYWAEWCGPCKMIAPVLDDIASTYEGKLTVAKLNIDENQETPPKYGVRGIPTLMLFKGGNVEATKVGALSKSQLAAFLDSNI